MSEFIGSRISLISKSDIRYVGQLHEIDSAQSTVALENVKSFGTEGRRANPNDEIAPSDNIYEYIVFRGSDVKDLRIEETPKENMQPPPVPDDPAILGSGSRPTPQNQAPQRPQQGPRPNGPPHFQQPTPFGYPQYGQFQNAQHFGGPHGPPPAYHGPLPGGPGGPGFHQQYAGGPYGAPPPGWGPPNGQGFPHQQGPFSPNSQPPMPFGAPGQQQPPLPAHQQASPTPPSAPTATQATPQQQQAQIQAPRIPPGPPSKSNSSTPAPSAPAAQGPPPPLASKPDAAAAAAPPTGVKQAELVGATAVATGPPSKVALPFQKSDVRNGPKPPSSGPPPSTNASTGPKPSGDATVNAALQYQNATKAATAAVAAAMAKLPPGPGGMNSQQQRGGLDNLAQKVNEMRVDDSIRHSRAPGTGGYAAGNRGGRGVGRGGRGGRGLEVPKTDFDFESANAKFNKEDLVKEAIASGEPLAVAEGPNGEASTNGDGAADDDVVIPSAPSMYSKASFFDNISSEAKDRDDGANGPRPSGQEQRGEERRRNYDTFGMTSVDGGFRRGGFRGRGRGFRGRGDGAGRGDGYGRGGRVGQTKANGQSAVVGQ